MENPEDVPGYSQVKVKGFCGTDQISTSRREIGKRRRDRPAVRIKVGGRIQDTLVERMMSSNSVFAVCLFASVVLYCVNAQQGNFGNGNINSLLSDTNLVQREIRCILDKGPCDQIGKQLKGE